MPIQDEFAHAQGWARRNKMIINFAKTKEIVFLRPHPNRFSVFPSFSEIELVCEAKPLRVTFSGSLSFEKYVQETSSCCSKHFYLLKGLRDRGMPITNLMLFSFLLLSIALLDLFLLGEAIQVLNMLEELMLY